jgi:copper transport protein
MALVAAPDVSAHALLRQSEPPDGAVLQEPPDRAVITFTEEPEPALSLIKVVDSSGREVDTGPVGTVAGQPLSLQLQIAPLPRGIYTVTWRTVSRVDGHVTGGAFAFGIGIAPAGTTPQPAAPPPSILNVVARWIFYVGLSGLIGAAWVWGIAFPTVPSGGARVLTVGWLISMLGLVALAESQRADAGATFGQLLSTGVGRALAWRAGAILLAGTALAIAFRVPEKRRRSALNVVVCCVLAAIFAHVIAGHAGASTGVWRWAKVLFQWAHMSAAAVWLGGLAALLIGLRGGSIGANAVAVRRFSSVAGVALFAVIATGAARAIDEVGTWALLLTTTFGRLVIVKIALLLALAALGAVNRYRHVPAVPRSLAGLRRVGATELTIATAVFAVTGLLTSIAPASLLEAASRPAPLVVTGSDFGTTVRARLEVTPGTPGFNAFTLRLTDYDTGRPFTAQRVSVRFSPLDRAGIGPSTLTLADSGAGVFVGRGSNLSIEGRWQVVVTVERGVNSVEIPLTLALRIPPAEVQTIRVPGQPTLYTVKVPGASVQVYLDPERPGPTTVHLTFFDPGGNELPITAMPTVTAALQSGEQTTLSVRRFGLGHFVAEGTLPGGVLELQITAQLTAEQFIRTLLPIRL